MTTPHLVIPTDAMSVAALADALAAVAATWPDAELATVGGGGIVIELPTLTGPKAAPAPPPKIERPRAAAAPPPVGKSKMGRKPGGGPNTNDLVLAALAEHGPIISDTGIAVRLLCDHVPRSVTAVNKALAGLVAAGDVIVDRNVAAKRTYAISLPGQALPPRSTPAPSRPALAPAPAKEPTFMGRRSDAPTPSRGIVDHVRTEGLRDKLAARAEAAVE